MNNLNHPPGKNKETKVENKSLPQKNTKANTTN
jgi:hypothetical protein